MSVRSIKNLKHILTLTRLRNVVLLLLLIAGVAVAPTVAQAPGIMRLITCCLSQPAPALA